MTCRAQAKAALWVLLLSGFGLLHGCGLFESSQEKAGRHYQSGVAAMEAGKFEEALIHFQNSLQKNPYHTKAHHRLGTLYIRNNQLYMAVREFSTAVRQDPDFKEPRQSLAILSYQHGAYDQTVAFCSELLEKWGNDLDILILMGDSLVRLNKVAEAKQAAQRCVDAYPEDPRARILLSRVFLMEKRPEEARKMMEKASALAPGEISVQLSLAGFYETASSPVEAEEAFRRIRRDFPTEPNGYLMSAQFYLRRQRPVEAEAAIREALGANIRDPRLYQTLANIQHRRKDHDAALRSLEAAVAVSDAAQQPGSMLLVADYHLFRREIPKTFETYEMMLRKWPHLVGVKIRVAELLFAEKRFPEAQQKIDEITAKHSDSSGGHLLKGLLDLKDRKIGEARKAFLTSRSLSPQSPDPYYYYGLTFLMEGDYKNSLPEMLAALDRNPDSRLVRLAVSYIYLRNEKFPQALSHLDALLEEQRGDYRARSLRASVYQRMGNHQAASSDYRTIIEQNPGIPELPLFRYRFAETLQAQGKHDEALREYESILEVHPSPIRPLERIVRIHLASRRHEKALAVCDDYLKKTPGGLEAGLLKAEVLISQGGVEAAGGFLKKLIQENPGSEQPVFLMGRLNERRGDIEAALGMYQKAVEINPNHVEGHMALGAGYQRAGEFQKAVNAYESLLAKGFFAPAANDLAFLYADLEQKLDRALELAEKAREAMPQRPEVSDTLGWVHLKRKSVLLARKHLKDALASRPLDPVFHYHMALADYEENNLAGAVESMRKAMQLGLGGREARHARKVIEESQAVEGRVKGAKALADEGKHKEAAKILEELMSTRGFYAPAAIGLARIYSDRGENLDHAQELAEKAGALLPGSAEASDTMGWILLKKGSPLLAKKHFHEAIRSDPRNAQYRYHLGMVLHLQKDFSEAEKELRAAVQLGLKGEPLADAKRMLETGSPHGGQ